MIISEHEKRMLIITVVFMLFAVVAFKMRPQIDKYKAAKQEVISSQSILNEYKELISQKATWESVYDEKADLMPIFDAKQDQRTYWNRTLNDIAATNNITLIQLDIGEEKLVGDVYELPIECKQWEGELPALISFLHALHSEGAMLDVRKLTIRPGSNKSAHLRGTFTLYCAYMRSENKE